ncbi:DUF2730 family protein [Desulfocurvus vexinensis]|uniref:DUF2730 family protein n=1 Tax=Desulfocurvus vexinensis TaxID=399548 RepID=UPI0004B8BB5E|nr:DUF2730 family protein [Desulfocurvus vexinensis]
MELNLEVAEFVLRIVQVLVVPLLGWLGKIVLDLRREVTELRGRVRTNEDLLKELPGNGEWHNLSLSIEGLRGDIKRVDAKIDGVDRVIGKMDRVLDRQEDYLLNCGSKK